MSPTKGTNLVHNDKHCAVSFYPGPVVMPGTEAMEQQASEAAKEEVDRLSDLPEPILLHILSFLPSHLAARTSVLSSRFRHLWTATPTLILDRSCFRLVRRFITMAKRSFRQRDPSSPISHLCINTGSSYNRPLPIASISSWISSAYSLRMRNLSLKIHCRVLPDLMPVIYSLKLLESLSLSFFDFRGRECKVIPSTPIPLIHLKHLELKYLCMPDLIKFIRELPSVEYLHLEQIDSSLLELSSLTVKHLKLSGLCGRLGSADFFFPRLEVLELSIDLTFIQLFQFKGEMPLLTKAIIKLLYFDKEHVSLVKDFLKSMINIGDLKLLILPVMINSDPYHVFVEQDKEPPVLANLKSFSLSTCFTREILEDLIYLLHYLPLLESLQLACLDPVDKKFKSKRKIDEKLAKRNLEPKTLLSSKGTNCFYHYTSLNFGERKQELLKFFSEQLESSKRVKK